MEIGWIGLGNMGEPMAQNVLKAGHKLTVYNRTQARAGRLGALGATVAKSPAEAAASGCVVTMVSDDPALEDVVFGPDKVLSTLPEGGIHVSMSTISVALSRRLAEAHHQAGQDFVSAPVFGRPEAAASAKLFVVAAGNGSALQRLDPLFRAIGQRTFIAGQDPSTANVIKLSGNFLIASVIESLAEAFALTRKHGVDPGQYLELLTASLFNSPVYKIYGELIANASHQRVGFAMTLGLKDVRLVLAAAENAAVPMPIASLVRDRLLSGVAQGMGTADWSAVGTLAAKNAGLE
jgi:3-hydroxyisobutyrate dehydrogenase-like beta-hydroxyacid dehydrogenase